MIHLNDVTPRNWDIAMEVSEFQRDFVLSPTEIMAKAYAYRQQRSHAQWIYSDETPVGLCMFYDREDFEAYQLSAFLIDRNCQGQGYGTSAIAALLSYLRRDGKYQKVRLGCMAENETALALYRRCGFREIDREDDEIILELKI